MDGIPFELGHAHHVDMCEAYFTVTFVLVD